MLNNTQLKFHKMQGKSLNKKGATLTIVETSRKNSLNEIYNYLLSIVP